MRSHMSGVTEVQRYRAPEVIDYWVPKKSFFTQVQDPEFTEVPVS